jgi:hypothetical protein
MCWLRKPTDFRWLLRRKCDGRIRAETQRHRPGHLRIPEECGPESPVSRRKWTVFAKNCRLTLRHRGDTPESLGEQAPEVIEAGRRAVVAVHQVIVVAMGAAFVNHGSHATCNFGSSIRRLPRWEHPAAPRSRSTRPNLPNENLNVMLVGDSRDSSLPQRRSGQRCGDATGRSSHQSESLDRRAFAAIIRHPSRSGGMADAGDSKSPVLTGMRVRLPPPAPALRNSKQRPRLDSSPPAPGRRPHLILTSQG